MKIPFFELLALVLVVASLFFFHRAIGFLSSRDYVSSFLVALIGVSTITVAKEMARFALAKGPSN